MKWHRVLLSISTIYYAWGPILVFPRWWRWVVLVWITFNNVHKICLWHFSVRWWRWVVLVWPTASSLRFWQVLDQRRSNPHLGGDSLSLRLLLLLLIILMTMIFMMMMMMVKTSWRSWWSWWPGSNRLPGSRLLRGFLPEPHLGQVCLSSLWARWKVFQLMILLLSWVKIPKESCSLVGERSDAEKCDLPPVIHTSDQVCCQPDYPE